MKVFVADNCESHTIIELVSGKAGTYQSPIKGDLFDEVRSLNQSDVVLIPTDSYHFGKYPEYISYVKDLAKLKLVLYSNRGDFPTNLRLQNTLELRVALNPGESQFNKIVVPYNVEPLDALPVRKFQKEPSISFLGYVPIVSPQRIYKAFRQSPTYPVAGNGAAVRHLMSIKASQSNLDIRFARRKQYGIAKSESTQQDSNRREYLNYMASSDFVLCPRGDANQSARFYETLSAGRIPLVPNSNITYPSAMQREQNKVTINLPLIFGSYSKHVSTFWQGISSQNDYDRLQRSIRDLYSKQLEFNAFFHKFFKLSLDELKRQVHM